MLKHKKIAVGLALAAALALSLPSWGLAMMGGGGMISSIAGAMGNMMGFNQQNSRANLPQTPAAPISSQGSPGYGHQGYPGYGNPGARPMGTVNHGGSPGAAPYGYPNASGPGYR
jgi:hypothetical protein